MLQSIYEYPANFALYIFALISAISVHEFAHAKAADILGDPTPRLQKRLTLNPLSHLDPYGIIFLIIVGFGWGKPVIFDPFNLKNPKKDSAIISFAGPLANLVVALLAAIMSNTLPSLTAHIFPFISLNIMLCIFNLIPIHPLDGFKIVSGVLTGKRKKSWDKLEKYGLIFLVLLILPIGENSVMNTLIQPLTYIIVDLLLW